MSSTRGIRGSDETHGNVITDQVKQVVLNDYARHQKLETCKMIQRMTQSIG